MSRYHLLIIGVILSLSLNLNTRYLSQTEPVQVEKSWVVVDFPRHILFHLKAQSQSEITQILLVYGTDSVTCINNEAHQQVEFQPSKSISVEWDWDLNRSGGMPPGVELWWRWELTDSSGNQYVTERFSSVISDNNFSWQSLKNNSISVYWSSGNATFGAMVLNQAVQSLDRLSQKAGLTYPNAINIFVYPSAEDLKKATLHMPDWIGGIAFSEFNTTIMAIGPNETAWISKVVPHELSHLVTDYRTFNCSGGRVPTWLNEGLAMFAEGKAKEDDLNDLTRAIRSGDLPGLTGLTAGFAANGAISNYEYTYSQVIITYLIDTYGVEKLDALLGKIKGGVEIDDALQEIYGLDTNGIDKGWRNSVGLAPVTGETGGSPTPTLPRTKVPTLALWTPVKSLAVPSETPQPSPTQPVVTQIPSLPPILPTPTATSVNPSSGQPSAWIYLAGGVVLIGLLVFTVVAILKRSR